MDKEMLAAIHATMQELLAPIAKDLEIVAKGMIRIEEKVDRLASEQPQDIRAILDSINLKLDAIKQDVDFTYKKASMNELEINRLKHQ